MTKTRASLIALLSILTLSAEGCRAQPPLVKTAGTRCTVIQSGRGAVDDNGRELVCMKRTDGKYYWTRASNN